MTQQTKQVRAVIKTSMGDITIVLNTEKAPLSVENFIQYARMGHYNGTIFHRVIKNFMIQGGGHLPDLKERETTLEPITNEATNRLKNDRYTIAMARRNEPHSATAQFFINTVDNDFLNHRACTRNDWGYAVFGEVIRGHEVVDKIARVKVRPYAFHHDVPEEPVMIEAVTIYGVGQMLPEDTEVHHA